MKVVFCFVCLFAYRSFVYFVFVYLVTSSLIVSIISLALFFFFCLFETRNIKVITCLQLRMCLLPPCYVGMRIFISKIKHTGCLKNRGSNIIPSVALVRQRQIDVISACFFFNGLTSIKRQILV